MSARMEKVREMMDTLPITYKGRKWDAALAEVEKWEAGVAAVLEAYRLEVENVTREELVTYDPDGLDVALAALKELACR